MLMTILIGAGAFVLGLSGAAMFVVTMTPPSPVAVASSQADSTATHGVEDPDVAHAAADSTASATEAVDAHAQASPAGGATSAAQPTDAVEPPDGTQELAEPAPIPAQDPRELLAYKGVGKLLSQMKPADAAKILVYMSDDQVEGILRGLGTRHAAVLLAQLPVKRAGKLSQRLLKPVPASNEQ